MSEDTKKPGVVRRAAGAVKGHVVAKRQFKIPTWIIYIIGVLGTIGVIYGGIQQARIWRWQKILKAAKLRIAELDAEKERAGLDATKRVATGQLKVTKKKIKKIDTKITNIDKRRAKIKKTAGRMDPFKLRDAFRNEGIE
jgi:hypothetical protein